MMTTHDFEARQREWDEIEGIHEMGVGDSMWVIRTRADCEGDWFEGAPEDSFYPSYEAAVEAAWAAYRGPDEYGNRAYAEALLVENVDVELDDPQSLWVFGGRVLERRMIDLGVEIDDD